MSTIELGRNAAGEVSGIRLDKGNRHGFVTGATGTGKTVTLQRMAEGFSRAGVPVFAADVKGDLSGIAASSERGRACTVKLWDVFREHGTPIKTSVHRIGPLLMARMLNCNQVQEGALNIAFKIAADTQCPMLSLEDLRWTLHEMLEDRAEICARYGNVTSHSVAAIQREILALEAQGAHKLFGEPPFSVQDLLQIDERGDGVVSILHADNLMEVPRLYAGLLLWLLTELFRELPEAGDLEKPRLVLFFDEAHLLFSDAPAKLLETVERTVRLVRSKGVGVFFVSQNPSDIPDTVLAQLGNRVQHALRAYTSREQRVVKSAADAFRITGKKQLPAVRDAMTAMGVGEALVSFMDEDGTPSFVEKVKVMMPESQIGPISQIERTAIMDKTDKPVVHDDDGKAFIARWRSENGIAPVPEGKVEQYHAADMHGRLGGLNLGKGNSYWGAYWRFLAILAVISLILLALRI